MANFFNSIHLPTLWQMLRKRMAARKVPARAQQATHALLRRSPLHAGVQCRATAAERGQIEEFLQKRLGLQLKAEQKLCRLTDGLDFLGYVIYPTHTLARRRVVAHLQQAVAEWEGQHVQGDTVRATPAALREITARVSSFSGHLRHANAHRLMVGLHTRYPWRRTAAQPRKFSACREGRRVQVRVSK